MSMKATKSTKAIAALLVLLAVSAKTSTAPVWPPPPDAGRVAYEGEIRCADLKPDKGLFGSIVRVIGGRGEDDVDLELPFDVVAMGERLYMTCQRVPALVEVNPGTKRFRLLECEELPFESPVALCSDGAAVYVTDGGSAAVYRFDGERVSPLIIDGLERPTGIAWGDNPGTLYVVDTGNHRIEMFDASGRPTGSLGERGGEDEGFNYPTFVSARDSLLLVNDTLNYRIKVFANEALLTAIGREGDGPGSFARPKGVAVDARGNVYVVDGLFDNVQVFDRSGRLLLVIGAAGSAPGEFWSPAGIDIDGDLIYVADTFNHRIQILRALGG
jgi:DNA-binding beta-propeller fold protein YncE